MAAPSTFTGDRVARPAPLRSRPRARPDLRVVEPDAARRARPSVLVAFGLVAVFGVLFGLAAFHTVLVQGQQRLDDLEADVDAHQDRFQRLRLEVAQLEAPARVVDVAVNQLGLVPVEFTTYLVPAGSVGAEVAAATGGTGGNEAIGATGDGEPGEQASAEGPDPTWAEVKPYLEPSP